MEIDEYFKQKKELYSFFINFIDNNNTECDSYQILIDFLEMNNILDNQEEFKELLHLTSEVYKNHYQSVNFFQRIEQFILNYSEKIKQTFSNSEIFEIFKNNKRILHFLFSNKIISITETVVSFIIKKSSANATNYCHFFFNEIKDSIDDIFRETIRRELLEIDEQIFDVFEEKCNNGQNDSYICQLIRKDSIDEFITFATKTNLNLSSLIGQSIFETNPFLMKNNQTTLIEYAAFFNSIQIFNFLRLNNVDLTSSLWLYAIHGKSAEIIHLLEDNEILPDDKSFLKCLEESIKCHHNDIANYFLNNFNDESDVKANVAVYAFHYYNYFYFQNGMNNNNFLFYYACQYNYYTLVDLFIRCKSIDINNKIYEQSIL